MDNNENHKPAIAAVPAKPISKGTKVLRAVFPWVASVLIFSGAMLVAWYENAQVEAGGFSGLAYVAFGALAALAMAANWFVYRDE